jgi:hypothetical protein
MLIRWTFALPIPSRVFVAVFRDTASQLLVEGTETILGVKWLTELRRRTPSIIF